MSFNSFLYESKKPTTDLLPSNLLPSEKHIDYYEYGLKDLESSAVDILNFLESHKLIQIDSDDVWEVMRKSNIPIHPSDVLFSMIAYKIKEWLQEKTTLIGVTINEKYKYISFNYEHDDDLDGFSYVQELLGIDDYGYVEDGKLKPLDKNSKYKPKFNF